MFEKTRTWIKNHKAEIAIVAAGGVAGAIIGGACSAIGYSMGVADAQATSNKLITGFGALLKENLEELGVAGHVATMDWIEMYAPKDVYDGVIKAFDSVDYKTVDTVHKIWLRDPAVKDLYEACDILINATRR